MMCIPKSFNLTAPCRTDFISVHSIDAFAHQLDFCSQERFTGQVALTIQMTSPRQWILYFEQGNLVWGTGGIHPVRRWHRHLSPYPFSQVARSVAHKTNRFEHWTYEILVELLAQRMIQPHDAEKVIRQVMVELLFDLCQQWEQNGNKSKLHMHFRHTFLDPANSALATIPVSGVWQQVMQDWEAWQQADLGFYSPNQAPLIADTRRLQQQVLSKTYTNLAALMDGQQTLRDLAIKANHSLIVMTKSLLPYIQQGLIKLQEIEDQPVSIYFGTTVSSPSLISSPFASSSLASSSLASSSLASSPLASSSLASSSFISSSLKPILPENAPLIAYIDDQKDDGQLMERILFQLGYRFIHIQDSIQALPTLLEVKPSLIFLDLVMPIINGYEACAQIRRISKFKDTPVIILTSNDGVIDRVRSKIVGATGFLSKPIDPRKIQSALQKMLSTQSSKLLD